MVILIGFFCSCQEEPNYNPFDDQFNVLLYSLARDKCDTITAGCGWFNLTQSEGRLRTFYQVELDVSSEVLAKGFQYHLDTFHLMPARDGFDYELADSIWNLPIDEDELNRELSVYDYEFLCRDENEIQLINRQLNDTIFLFMRVNWEEYETVLIREMEFYQSKKKR